MCLALVWAGGGFSIWSTFGTMIICSLGWDHGPSITDRIKQAPYNILDMDWSGEGYQLWAINSADRRFTGNQDKEFCPFPKVRSPILAVLRIRFILIRIRILMTTDPDPT